VYITEPAILIKALTWVRTTGTKRVAYGRKFEMNLWDRFWEKYEDPLTIFVYLNLSTQIGGNLLQ
jgi:hypothetical protein